MKRSEKKATKGLYILFVMAIVMLIGVVASYIEPTEEVQTEAEQTPTETEQTPTETEQTPTEAEQTPTEAEQVPAETEQVETEPDVSQSDYMDISTIEPSMEGEFVEVSGEIISREDHEDGHVFLVIDDGSGSINVPIFVEENIDTTGLVVGEEIVVQGAVKMYEGELEVNPGSPDDVRIVE